MILEYILFIHFAHRSIEDAPINTSQSPFFSEILKPIWAQVGNKPEIVKLSGLTFKQQISWKDTIASFVNPLIEYALIKEFHTTTLFLAFPHTLQSSMRKLEIVWEKL